MKVLWITETPLPEALNLLDPARVSIVTRGWLQGLCDALLVTSDVDLYVASPSEEVSTIKYLQGVSVTHILFPKKGDNRKYIKVYELFFNAINTKIAPEVVHIHGTEYSQGLAFVRACGSKNVVVSIQGLISEIAKFYLAGIDRTDLFRYHTLGDLFLGLSMSHGQKSFEKRGLLEQELIKSVKNVIGRTNWDKAHVFAINPHIKYYFCNESLRNVFYHSKWTYKDCSKYSVFLSQSSYPVKGLHFVIKAVALLREKYPKITVRIAGCDITKTNSLKSKLLFSQYGNYISHLIDKLDLRNIVSFTGTLDAEQMRQEYLNANCFILSSTIENSSNSLGEAQLLGVPCIASHVGGTPDMIPNSNLGLMYKYDDYVILSELISQTFERSDIFVNDEMRNISHMRHDWQHNATQMMTIYEEVKKNHYQ